LVEKSSPQPEHQRPLPQIETGVIEVDISSKKAQWKMRALYAFIFLTSLGLTVVFLSWWDTFKVNKRKENTALLASLVKVTDARRAVSLPQTVTQPDTTPTLQEVLQQLPNVFVPPVSQPHTTSQTSGQATEQVGGTPVTAPTSQNVYECPDQICTRIRNTLQINPKDSGLREVEIVAIGSGAFFAVHSTMNVSTVCTNNQVFADELMKTKYPGESKTVEVDQTCYTWLNANGNSRLMITAIDGDSGGVFLRFIK
jgi:hypothetical protein